MAFTACAGCCGSEASASRGKRLHWWSWGCSPDGLNSGDQVQILFVFFFKYYYFLMISDFFFLIPKFWFDVTNYKYTVEIPVWSLSVTLTLNPSDYKGRYSVSKLQKTDGGNKKTTHTTIRGREVCVDRRWMRGISYLESSSVSSGPSHQDWTLLKAYSVASEPQKQWQKKTNKQTKKPTLYMYIKLVLLRQLWLVYMCVHK